MRLSLCTAKRRNTSPRCARNCPYRAFLRYFGMKITWYLHSHFVWLRLLHSSIIAGLPFVCLAAHDRTHPTSNVRFLTIRRAACVRLRSGATARQVPAMGSRDQKEAPKLRRVQRTPYPLVNSCFPPGPACPTSTNRTLANFTDRPRTVGRRDRSFAAKQSFPLRADGSL
jgi:hypothetical protein